MAAGEGEEKAVPRLRAVHLHQETETTTLQKEERQRRWRTAWQQRCGGEHYLKNKIFQTLAGAACSRWPGRSGIPAPAVPRPTETRATKIPRTTDLEDYSGAEDAAGNLAAKEEDDEALAVLQQGGQFHHFGNAYHQAYAGTACPRWPGCSGIPAPAVPRGRDEKRPAASTSTRTTLRRTWRRNLEDSGEAAWKSWPKCWARAAMLRED